MSRPSFNAVNYSLRPSKTIQRGLVFEGLRHLSNCLDWESAYYIGFGSVWFTDFSIAHRVLNINKMISIERNLIGYRRARFNKPFRFVKIRRGLSFQVLPKLMSSPSISKNPVILWLDYDSEVDEDKVDELDKQVQSIGDDGVLLFTYDASEKRYGSNWREVLRRLGELFGERSIAGLSKVDVTGEGLQVTIANLIDRRIRNVSNRMRKSNKSISAFRILYKDKAPMVTVGAVFPASASFNTVSEIITERRWPGIFDRVIAAPHLTSKEVASLQGVLPSSIALNRSDVKELGFDLEVEQIEIYQRFYKYYPTFAQILS